MPDKQNQTIIYIVVGIAVILIAGGWLFFKTLNSEQAPDVDTAKLETDLEVEKMKNIAQENLEFFDPEIATSSLWSLLDRSFQYDELDKTQPEVRFNLNNPGNEFPFQQPVKEEETATE